MSAYILKYIHDVLGNHVIPSGTVSMCFCHAVECQRTAGTDAETDKFMIMGGFGKARDVGKHLVFHVDIVRFCLHLKQILACNDLLYLLQRICILAVFQNIYQTVRIRIAHL